MLKNYDSLILPKDIFYCETQNQVKWVKNKLMEKGIDENSLIIKNIDNKKVVYNNCYLFSFVRSCSPNL